MEKNFFQRTADRIWQAYKRFFGEHRVASLFITVVLFGFVGYLIGVLIGGKTAALQPFFRSCADLFMDFFNSLRDASQGEAAYTERYIIYPPMAAFIMLVFSWMLPAEYLSTSFGANLAALGGGGRYSWVEYPTSYLAFVLYMGIPLVLLFLLCYRAYRKGKITRVMFASAVLVSFPVLFMVERGNILILSVIAVLFYVLNYNSESRVRRELALIALAFAFSLKLYPALLGLPLLADKRYKDGIRCAIYALLLFFLPSFFFGGPQCVLWIFQNLGRFSAERHAFWGWPFAGTAFATFADYLPCLFAALLFVVATFLRADRYKVWMLGITVLFAYPSLNAAYAWTFFLAPLLLLFAVESPKRIDWIYAALLCLPFALLSVASSTVWHVVSTVCLFALLAVATVDLVRTVKQRLAANKTTSPAEQSEG